MFRIPYKTVSGLAGAVGSIVHHELNAAAYTPTFSSTAPAIWNVASTAIPAFVLGIHEEAPTGGYKQENRHFLSDATPHVRSVNDKLEKANVGLSAEMAYTLLKQDEARLTHGSAEDFAHEQEIMKGFFSEFEFNLNQGKSLMEQGGSSEDLAKIKHEATYNLVGAAAHATFASVKKVGYGLATTPGLNKLELHKHSQKQQESTKKHSVQLKQEKNNINTTTTFKEVLAKQQAEIMKEKTDSNVEKKDLSEKKNDSSFS